MATGNHMTAREFLGREIRRAREARSVNGRKMGRPELARELFVSESLVAAWESGRQIPKVDYVLRLIKVLRFDPEILVRILEDLVEREVSPEWTGKWLAIEKMADLLLSYEHAIVPGLLQTPEYAETVLRQAQPLADIGGNLADRLKRQEILQGEDAPTVVFVLDERVLRNRVGGATIMNAQISKLIEMANLPNVIIQIIPDEAGHHPAQAGAFMIAKFKGVEVVYQDGTWRGQVLEDCRDVAAFSRLWMNTQSAALDRTASLDLMEKAAAEWTP
ncbi:helix-turn-helix domain-containing protein [Actinomadura scrupuli]|uniref:helix-turn-helix domain-containing protein n=1 Tax=Actinomadura scrupuli TaxID=559629 RepID=UPI003D953C63